MLYPSNAQSKSRKAVAPAKPVNWKKVSMGDTVDTGQVPPVAGQTISIRATVEADKPHGVVVSHGGSNIGYVFYFDRGRPVFMVKPGKGVENRISSKATFSGEIDIVAKVNSTAPSPSPSMETVKQPENLSCSNPVRRSTSISDSTLLTRWIRKHLPETSTDRFTGLKSPRNRNDATDRAKTPPRLPHGIGRHSGRG